ncbi:MAG: MFS transporter, partial [Burkholderiales bacterium]|nr:MFS transporter [Burkholderiales bacterium]
MSQPISSPPSSALLSAAMTSARTYALALMPVFPRPVARLLISSFVFVLGRAVALPFMVLYLTRHLGLTQNQVGWILGGSIMVATVSGLYSGFLVDRISKQKLMSVACLMVALCSLLLSVAAYALAAFAMLALIEAALVLRSVSLKAMLADFLPPAKRTRAFSMNYLLINLAFALGPVLGAYAYGVQISSPLWLSAGFALLATWVVNAKSAGIASALAAKESPVIASPARTSFSDTLHDLKSDRRLILFTLGSVLTSFVFGRFISGYLAQYLLISRGVRMATELIPVILMTNAVGVVVLQYAIGKRIQHQHLFAWVCVGVLL